MMVSEPTKDLLQAIPMTRRRLLRWLGAAMGTTAALGVLAACGGSGGSDAPSKSEGSSGDGGSNGASTPSSTNDGTSESKVGGQWTIAISEDPDTLDPQKTAAAVTGGIFRYVGDTLVTKDFDKNIVPSLATKYEVSDDGLVWTFEIREGVMFHDGTPADAAAIKASFERALAPETASPIASGLLGPVDTISVEGSTLRVTLKEPFAIFLDNMTDPRSAPISVAAAEQAGDQFGRKPIATGPWKVAEWQSGTQIVLERNPDYAWGPAFLHDGAAYIDRLVYRIMPEPATAMTAFEAGEVDQVSINPPDVERIESSGKYQIVKFLRNGVGLFMEFNVTKSPFDDITVRQAMNYAINKEDVLQTGLDGLGEIAYGPLPPSIWGYWEGIEDYAPSYNPDKALELLSQAGWTKNSDGLLEKDGQPFMFTLLTMATDTWSKSAQVVQAQLKQLGITMEIQTFEFATLLEKMKAGEHQAGFMGYTYTSPDILYVWFHSSNIGSGLTLSHHKDDELDKMIEESRSESDEDKRLQLYQDIQKYIVDKALWVPLWINYNYIGLQKRIANARVHPEGFVALFDASITE